ncbi:MAG: L,D-transpeptidase [Rhizobiales bacterium]|nr:L,D-transpeptidase [Hyphomicrobiales bacterium]MBI3674534.1 L,D-transpeptidase [Hyphomicrobiales bacterium]
MSKFIKSIAAAALAIGLISGAASAKTVKPFEGVVIVPASANPMQDDSSSAKVKSDSQPQFKRARIVAYNSPMAPGSIIIDTREHALYFVLGNGMAARYRVGTAKPGFEWSGTHPVASKTVWPDWRPPVEMRARRPELPEYMAGGPENPLGARAIYIGGTLYRIHGTNEPKSIGKSVSSGCIRMLNEDVSELYQFVKLGATVTVI